MGLCRIQKFLMEKCFVVSTTCHDGYKPEIESQDPDAPDPRPTQLAMGAHRGRKPPSETRTAPDGIRYTKADFFAFFAGYDEWDAAAPVDVAANAPVDVAANAPVDVAANATPPAGARAGVETDRRANTRTTSTTLAHLSESTFDSLGLHPPLERAITEVFHYERMTLVQQLAIPVCIDPADRDVVAKARTGTGKTIGFLLPALHRVLSRPPSSAAACCPILVLSPTRELATQTAEEAKDLLRFVSPSKVMTVLGGTSMAKDASSFQQGPPVVLVATPGRLDDHLNNTVGVREMLTALCVLVMDEADQLLDRGFRPSIVKILAMLPPPDTRQTLLFSATFPSELQEVSRRTSNYCSPPAPSRLDARPRLSLHSIPTCARVNIPCSCEHPVLV